MDLKDVQKREDLAEFYNEHGLSTVDEKINGLKKALGVIASRDGDNDTPEEALTGYEDLILSHIWEKLRD